MNRKKAAVYLSVLLILTFVSYFVNKDFLLIKTTKLPDMCKVVFTPECGLYMNKLIRDEDYVNAEKLLEIRIYENKKVLSHYKNKLKDKSLLNMQWKEIDEAAKKSSTPINKNVDYEIMVTNNVIVNDIISDSLILADIQSDKLNKKIEPFMTRTAAKIVLSENKYFIFYDNYSKKL